MVLIAYDIPTLKSIEGNKAEKEDSEETANTTADEKLDQAAKEWEDKASKWEESIVFVHLVL